MSDRSNQNPRDESQQGLPDGHARTYSNQTLPLFDAYGGELYERLREMLIDATCDHHSNDSTLGTASVNGANGAHSTHHTNGDPDANRTHSTDDNRGNSGADTSANEASEQNGVP